MPRLEDEIRDAFERRLAAVPAHPDLRARIGRAVAGRASHRQPWGIAAATAALLLAGGVTFYVLATRHSHPAPIIGPSPSVQSPTPTGSPTACSGPAPATRARAGLAYDSARHALVMFGGLVRFPNQTWDFSATAAGETWTFSDGCWHLQQPAISPPGRELPVLAYDSVRKVTVLFGGYDTAGAILSDTWIWDGSSWSQVNAGTRPDVFSPQGAFDPMHGVLVVFGVALNAVPETWIWDGVRWTRQSPAVSPAPRVSGLMAYDPMSRQILLFGGNTWLWDGSNWTQQHPAVSPGPEATSPMASGRTVVLLAQGRETWLWLGSTWKQATPAQSPVGRGDATAAGNGQYVWLFGGLPGDGSPGTNLWLWDGSTWSPVQ